MQYDWILFDADETLFSFDAFAGLRRVFTPLGVDFSEQDYQEYQRVNQPLWMQYQEGEIDAAQLQEQRFIEWGKRLAIPPLELNQQFLNAMAEICQPFDGVQATLNALTAKVKLGIITNGFNDMQEVRLKNTGLVEYFEFVVVSEHVGKAKPDKAIFEYAFSMMEKLDKSRILMVGDNLSSDIQGGINAGIDTCWLNLHGQKTLDGSIKPTFSVSSWSELAAYLLPATDSVLLAEK